MSEDELLLVAKLRALEPTQDDSAFTAEQVEAAERAAAAALAAIMGGSLHNADDSDSGSMQTMSTEAATMTDATNNDRPLTLAQASEFLAGRVSDEAVRKALVRGDLRGRNLGGNVGWLTTEAAIIEWIKGGNAGKVGDEHEG